jgi:hypothetical protein
MTTMSCIMIVIAASLCLVSSMAIGDNQSSMEIGDNQSSMEIGDTKVDVGSENVFFMKMLEEYTNPEDIRSEEVFFMKMLKEYNNAEDIRSEEVFFMKILEEYINPEDIRLLLKSCKCTGYTCSCCVNLPILKEVCIQVSFIPGNLTLDITLTLNGKVILHTKISGKNPPPICVGIPLFPKLAGICLRLYDIQIQNRRLHACIAIEVKLVFKVIKLKIGCFNIPPGQMHSMLREWSDLRAINDAGIL